MGCSRGDNDIACTVSLWRAFQIRKRKSFRKLETVSGFVEAVAEDWCVDGNEKSLVPGGCIQSTLCSECRNDPYHHMIRRLTFSPFDPL